MGTRRLLSRLRALCCLAAVGGHPLAAVAVAQDRVASTVSVGDSVVPILIAWATQVRAGAGPATWSAASARFRQRIMEEQWSNWVLAQHDQWEGVGPPRVLHLVFARDEAPLPPAEWVTVVLAHDRQAGGQVLERVVAVWDADSTWRVVDYGVGPDSRAMVTNAYFAPIPYFAIGWRSGFSHPFVRRPSGPVRAPDPTHDRAVANPTTFPRRPP